MMTTDCTLSKCTVQNRKNWKNGTKLKEQASTKLKELKFFQFCTCLLTLLIKTALNICCRNVQFWKLLRLYFFRPMFIVCRSFSLEVQNIVAFLKFFLNSLCCLLRLSVSYFLWNLNFSYLIGCWNIFWTVLTFCNEFTSAWVWIYTCAFGALWIWCFTYLDIRSQ